MALKGKWVILYYGFLASLTGGWLPVRNKRPLLAIFHAVLFLTFIFIPVLVFTIRTSSWVGWFVYSLIIGLTFMVLKIINFRLHYSLGSDPVPEELVKEEEEVEEGEVGEGDREDEREDEREEGKSEEVEEKTQEEVTMEAPTATSEGAEKLEDFSSFLDILHQHQSSVSSLGRTYSVNSADSVQEVELIETSNGCSAKAAVAEVHVDETVDATSLQQQSDLTSNRSRSALKIPGADAAILGLMSPVHRSSSSNVDASGLALAAVASLDDGDDAQKLHLNQSYHTYHHNRRRNGRGPQKDLGIQRSFSMPPVMFETEGILLPAMFEAEGGVSQSSRNRERYGLCIQRNQASSRQLRHRLLESRSEDQLTTGGGREEGLEEEAEDVCEEGEGGKERMSESFPRSRRNAFRGTRVTRRATCAADGHMMGGAGVTRRSSVTSDRPALIPMISEAEEATVAVPKLEQRAKSRLLEDGHYFLEDVTHLLPQAILQAIVDDTISLSWYTQMRERVEEMKRGHLSSGDSDHTQGAIHWFEVGGDWDFYVFQFPEDEGHTSLDDLIAYQSLFMDYQSSVPPPLPPRSTLSGSRGEQGREERDAVPVFRIIPFIKKTEVPLNIQRKSLEDYMDRNVTWLEMVFTILLAILVCVVAALLLSLIDFYSGFWAFWFCYVVGTAHFSLIKSVQDDPASPSPGQNHIMAMGRAIFFIVCGVLALCIDAALSHMDSFTLLCVYGVNVNSFAVLLFVRNGFLIFILFFPILFMLGWIPQADTFSIYFLEQLDMNIFGGTASTGLVCSLYAIGRSILVAMALWLLGFAAFSTLEDGERLTCASRDAAPDDPGARCNFDDRVALSFYVGAIFAASFVLSRSTSNHQYLLVLMKRGWQACKHICCKARLVKEKDAGKDPLEEMYCTTLKHRMFSDVIVASLIFILTSLLSLSTGFCRSTYPAYAVYILTAMFGVGNHYLLPHIRKEMPWLCCSEPICKPNEWDVFEVTVAPVMSPIERVLQWTLFLEKNLLYPLSFLFALNLSAHHYQDRFGDFGAAAAMTIAGMKVLRTAWTDTPRQYIILVLTLLLFNFDYVYLSEGLPLNYFIVAIFFSKFYDLYLKIYFIYIYIAPWQSSWSSAGHIFIQPLLIPHTPLIFLQTLISSIINAPMNPVYASTLFVLSYARPIKYWEKNYNTKRADSSNTRLETQLEGSLRNPNPDRLDSLFYEHLTWVLQKDLCGDLVLGRWGRVASGDFFILTSDRLNALVHIIEYGNGFVTFQLRGLEFRGTYCHQREVEAITESISDDEGCCCAEPGHFPGILSCNKLLGSRWLAWEVVSSCYTLHGYSISENQAHLVFNSFDYRRCYITYLVECIIYKLVRWSRLSSLLENETLQDLLREQGQLAYVDTDPLFDESKNCDFSHRHNGIHKELFSTRFQPYLRVCVDHEGLDVDVGQDSFLLTLCFAFTILGRRLFYQHAQQGAGRRNGDNFMNGLYRMFLGDARPNHPNDEWVFQDVDSIKDVIIPATRIALKVHQDNFSFSEEYDSYEGVYQAVKEVDENHIVTHENDHEWRTAVVTNQPSLLALRYQRTEDSYIYPYKLIRLTSKFIKFRVIKLNRACVRSLWTSQQHELIFLRNSDSERGSIQNHKPTLRNMVNSSMDLPIGYPIYVSPLQTSFVDRHSSYNESLLGKFTNPRNILSYLGSLRGICNKCKSCAIKVGRGGSRSRSTSKGDVPTLNTSIEPPAATGTQEGDLPHNDSIDSLTGIQYEAPKSYEDPFPQSDSDSEEQLWKPMWVSKRVAVTDTSEIFENFKMAWLKWRLEDRPLAEKAMKANWKAWRPQEGMEGEVVHEWRPFHIDPVQRSHIDKIILLVRMTDDLYVLIREQGVKEMHSRSV